VECLQRHRRFADIPGENVALEFRHGLLGVREDNPKSYGLEVPYLSCYDEQTFRALQTEVFTNFPDWSIQWAPACSVIYADRVVTDDGEVVNDLGAHVRQPKEAERERLEDSRWVLHRQIAWMQPRIPQLLDQISETHPFVVVAVVDRLPRRSECYGVWILSTNEFETPFGQSTNLEPLQCGSFPVNETGEVFRRWWVIVDGQEKELSDVPYALYCWGIRKDVAEQPIEIVDPAADKTTIYQIRKEEIAIDTDIPALPIR
jgi:hypothetical protein